MYNYAYVHSNKYKHNNIIIRWAMMSITSCYLAHTEPPLKN